MGIVQTVENITPRVADKYLSANKGNRKVRVSHVSALAGAIRRGEWRLTHQGIAFSETGRLIDGQHRLHAVVESGLPITTVVVRGLPEESFIALDQGARRSTTDVLGADQKAVEAATLACIIHDSANTTRPTSQQVSEWLGRIAGIHEELIAGSKVTTKFMTCTGMRLAAILTVWDGVPKDYVFPLYRALASLDIDSLPAVGRALVAQVAGGVPGGRGSGRATSYEALIRGSTVFDPAKAESRRVIVRDRASAMAWARSILAQRARGA